MAKGFINYFEVGGLNPEDGRVKNYEILKEQYSEWAGKPSQKARLQAEILNQAMETFADEAKYEAFVGEYHAVQREAQERAGRQRASRERASRERAQREQAQREQAQRERAARDQAEQQRANQERRQRERIEQERAAQQAKRDRAARQAELDRQSRRSFRIIVGLLVFLPVAVGVIIAVHVILSLDKVKPSRTIADSGAVDAAFSPNGSLLAIAAADVDLFNPATGRLITTLSDPQGAKGGTLSVAFSPNGKMLASGDRNGRTYLWDLATGHVIITLPDPDNRPNGIWSVAFSPNGKMLATADSGGNTYLWDTATGRRTAVGGNTAVAFSPNGKTLATAGNSNTYLWDTATGQRINTLSDPNYPVSAVAFSPDGRILASGDAGADAQLWNLTTGKDIADLTFDDSSLDGITGLTFSPNKKVLAVADGPSAFLWDETAGKIVAELDDPNANEIDAIAISPNGSTLVTVDNGKVNEWNIGQLAG